MTREESMRKILLLPFLVPGLLAAQDSRAQQGTNASVSGRWTVTTDVFVSNC